MSALLTKLLWSRWLHIGQVLCCTFIDRLGSITSRWWGNEPALLPRTDGPACLFSGRPERAVDDRTKLAKKRTLTQGPPREIPSILPVRVANQNEEFASSCSRADLAI